MPLPHPYAPLQPLTKFVVIGGCGFVGRWTALELAAACPSAAVVAFDVSRATGTPFASLFDDAELDVRKRGGGLRGCMGRVRVEQGSVLCASDLDRAIAGADVVFNTAAYGMASVNGAAVDMCYKVSVNGDACDMCGTRR